MATREFDANIHILDAAYAPFPTFKEWQSRTSLDTVRWERYTYSLKRRAAESSPEILERARNVAKRAAALDTGAIEGLYEVDRGFTYTVALETATWEAALALKGEYVKSLFEAQLHAYEYVLDLATKAEPISEAAIRALHVEICQAQTTYRVMTAVGPQEQGFPKGQYKVLPNHVRTRKGTDHSYAPVDVTPAEMARLTAELRSDEFLAAHPVIQASYAHYCFVVIHPFADGNGRVARALASAFSYRAISMPIIILSEQKDAYLNALESADSGDYQAFVDFMLARSLDTIGLVAESLRSAAAQPAEVSLTAIEGLYVTRGGYTYEQVDDLGIKFIEAVQNAVHQGMSKFLRPKIKYGGGITGNAQYGVPSGYRVPLSGGRVLQISLYSLTPAQANTVRSYCLILPKDAASDDDIQIVNVSDPLRVDALAARIDELIPSVSGILQIRLNMFAERIVNEMFGDLQKKAAEAIGKRS